MTTDSWPRMERLMRSLHLYSGLFLTPWMLVYATSAFCLNHGEWVREFLGVVPPNWEVVRAVQFAPADTISPAATEQARAILLELALDGPNHIQGKPNPEHLVITRHRINDVFPQLRGQGVRGIVSAFLGILPGVRDPFDLPDAVRWENSALRPGAGQYWGFMLSPRQGDMVRNLLRQGEVRVRAQIIIRTYDGEFHSATAVIPGAEDPDQEILFVSHLYEPGANDNASGVGIGLELAHSLNAAIRQGTLPRPRRSMANLLDVLHSVREPSNTSRTSRGHHSNVRAVFGCAMSLFSFIIGQSGRSCTDGSGTGWLTPAPGRAPAS